MPDDSEATLRKAHAQVATLEQERARSELATAWRLILVILAMSGRHHEAGETAELSIAHALIGGQVREQRHPLERIGQ